MRAAQRGKTVVGRDLAQGLERLARGLRRLAREFEVEARVGVDPVEIPRGYADPADAEVAGLVAASLAYGRVDLFKPVAERVVGVMGKHPARFARAFARRPDAGAFEGIVYRFNRGVDFAALVAAMGWVIGRHGSIGARFGELYRHKGGVWGGREALGRQMRGAPPAVALLGAEGRGGRGLAHLLADAGKGGACKRWNLYLRWMVRGPDAVDLGAWRGNGVPASALVIPLDVHVGRMARMLGLTRRSDASWRTAEEVTAALGVVDQDDPVRFDFVLCHLAMSGRCVLRRDEELCPRCALRGGCPAGGPVKGREAAVSMRASRGRGAA